MHNPTASQTNHGASVSGGTRATAESYTDTVRRLSSAQKKAAPGAPAAWPDDLRASLAG